MAWEENWFVTASSNQVRGDRPFATSIHGVPLVLFRTGESIVAAEDRCPHRNAPLSAGIVTNQEIRCPYHGWTFGKHGVCTHAPGMRRSETPTVSLRTWSAVERDGEIWVAPRATTVLPSVYWPTLATTGEYHRSGFVASLAGSFGDAMENLLDGTHTPFVHAGLVRHEGSKQTFQATVRREEERIEVEYRGEKGQSGFLSRWFEPERDVSFGRFVPPCTAELEYRSKRRTELLVLARMTPLTADCLTVHVHYFLPKQGWVPVAIRSALLKPFFRRIFHQDRRIVQMQHENIQRFGSRSYVHWKADVMRPWIDGWIETGRFPSQPDGARVVDFDL